MLALGARLAARGHEVTFETWSRWREDVEQRGMRFAAAPEYPVFPTQERPLKPYEAVVRACGESLPAMREFEPDAVVHDILTLAPALAGELIGAPVATLVPHLYPVGAPGLPPYSMGARLPRTALGRRLWRAADRAVETGLRQGRAEVNETRRKLGLPALERLHGGISTELCLVATFPALEYPRAWPPWVHVVGPLIWEPDSVDVEPPAGEDPLVLIAPSTSQDPHHRLLRSALVGLRDARVRVLAATNRRPIEPPVPVPDNVRLVDWLSYSKTMPRCALVVTHVGHGTLALALRAGCPVVAVPHAGDMGENAARVDWAGMGVRLPWRFLTPRTLRLAVERALADDRLRVRAEAVADWAARHDGPQRAAELVEELALSRRGAMAS